jgi:hypothetical protein
LRELLRLGELDFGAPDELDMSGDEQDELAAGDGSSSRKRARPAAQTSPIASGGGIVGASQASGTSAASSSTSTFTLGVGSGARTFSLDDARALRAHLFEPWRADPLAGGALVISPSITATSASRAATHADDVSLVGDASSDDLTSPAGTESFPGGSQPLE